MGNQITLKKFKMRKHYIITSPSSIRDVDDSDLFFDQIDYKIRQKAQRLQARRWRKLKHQLV